LIVPGRLQHHRHLDDHHERQMRILISGAGIAGLLWPTGWRTTSLGGRFTVVGREFTDTIALPEEHESDAQSHREFGGLRSDARSG
jgi:hypothetical protein